MYILYMNSTALWNWNCLSSMTLGADHIYGSFCSHIGNQNMVKKEYGTYELEKQSNDTSWLQNNITQHLGPSTYTVCSTQCYTFLLWSQWRAKLILISVIMQKVTFKFEIGLHGMYLHPLVYILIVHKKNKLLLLCSSFHFGHLSDIGWPLFTNEEV